MRLPIVLLLALPLAAQSPEFEVASIRPTEGATAGAVVCHLMKAGTERLQVIGITLNLLIIDAYEMDAERFDLPDWGRRKFDFQAKVPPQTDADGCRKMLKSFLAERFHLVVEVQTADVPTYFLKLAKNGFKFKPVAGPPPDLRASSASKSENGQSRWTFRAAPMSRVLIPVQAAIAVGLRAGTYETDRLVDETGLTGYYDGELVFQTPSANPDSLVPQLPSLKDALVDQAGLILELRKAPGKTLVLRSADRMPTEN